MLRRLLLPLLLGAAVSSCGSSNEPLCCVDVSNDGVLQALTCEDQAAIVNCEAFDFSDCYYDRIRDPECQ